MFTLEPSQLKLTPLSQGIIPKEGEYLGEGEAMTVLGNIYESPDLLTGRGEVTVEPGR